MSTLTRYLLRRVLGGIGMTLLAVVAVLTLIDFIDEARRVRTGGYSFGDVVQVILLTTPQRIYEMLPVSIFIGSLLSLGQLAANSEMVAMRAAGLGVGRIVRILLVMGLSLGAATIFIGERIAPLGVEKAWALKSQYRAPSTAQAGLWLRRDGKYIRVQREADRRQLSDVLLYEMNDEGRLQRSLHAQGAEFDGEHWVLQNVRETHLDAEGNVHTRHRAQFPAHVLPPVDVLELMTRPADEMPIADLERYLTHFSEQDMQLRSHHFAWWQRIALPLSCVAVLLLTIPFAFAQSREGGLGQRVFIGVLSGIAIYVFNRLFAHLGVVMGLAPWQAAFLPIAVLLLLGLAILTNRRIIAS